ncbi:MAG: AmmeMemoRadiSam system protein B [Candidatus Omnitrophica bacterium]|nr:AmmeMemoRadiSam system protein B [Candidatus Omnitrophota bacterium]
MRFEVTGIRRAAWAGQFYPGNAVALRRTVNDFLADARKTEQLDCKALVAPHAGYVYSGPVAASAFHHLEGQTGVVKRIILLGPSHRVAFSGLAASANRAFATPLGQVPLDLEVIEKWNALPQVQIMDRAHEPEHSLEVELPFLQVVLGEFTLVPLLTGDTTTAEVAEAINLLWGGPETRIVVSTDLSHYLDYDSAVKQDLATAQAIQALEPDEIQENQACGCTALRGLLEAARQHHLQARTVDLRNSGDTAGPRDRVVGYGAFVLGSRP